MAKAITQSSLDRLRREWQRRLKLQDWKITAKFRKQDEWPEHMSDAVGFNEMCLDAKLSEISILHPDSMDEENVIRGQNVEDTLIHELLHCHFQPFFKNAEPMRTIQEQAIEVITAALLGLKREKSGK